jgi:hypothetical protein
MKVSERDGPVPVKSARFPLWLGPLLRTPRYSFRPAPAFALYVTFRETRGPRHAAR